MNQSFNLLEFFKTLWNWRKPILIVCGIAIVGSVVITDPHIMPPYYESTAIFYPLNPNMTSSGTLFSGGDAYMFGGSGDIDRILSIASSAPLELYIVNKFHLFRHYKIDSAKEDYPIYAVLKEFEENYRATKNEKGAIEISVMDIDKNLAAEIANAVVNKLDETNRDLLNENKKKILAIYKKKKVEKEQEVKKLTDSIFNLKQKNNLYTDIEDLASQVRNSRNSGNSDYDAALENVKVLEEKKKGAIRELNNNIVQFEQFEASINSEVSTLFILQKAFAPEKKTKPVRWVIVLASLLICFMLSALAILLIERFNFIKAAFKNAEPEN
jgi:capsular polysaccharide biosynthesis protein